MIIVATGADVFKKEIESKQIPRGIEWIWVDDLASMLQQKDGDAFFDFEFQMKKERIDFLSALLPKPVFINELVHTLDQVGQPFIRINAWPTFLKRPVAEIAVKTEDQKTPLIEIFDKMSWQYQFVPDLPGMISALIICQVINEAYYTLQEKISTKEEIDIAMKLGTNYPLGPFEWSEKIGLGKIYELLSILCKTDHRYLPCDLMLKELN